MHMLEYTSKLLINLLSESLAGYHISFPILEQQQHIASSTTRYEACLIQRLLQKEAAAAALQEANIFLYQHIIVLLKILKVV